MAATAEAQALTEAHRLAQTRIGADTVQQILTSFQVLDPTAVDATSETWLRLALRIVEQQRDASSRLAGAYVQTFKRTELGAAATVAPVLAAGPDVATATSLLITGPYRLKQALGAGVDVAVAMDTASSAAAGSAMRHTLNGGRETVVETVRSDKRAHGWARATSGRACAFCAMLASRGPVYRADHANFRSHDHCSCSAEPVYRSDAEWPAGARDLQDLWKSSTTDLEPGDSPLNAFRRALAQR